MIQNSTQGMIKCPGILPTAKLPSLLKNGVEQFGSNQEQQLFLYSTIVAMSGVISNVHGSYGQSTCFPNLFFMGVAPAASGKGVMLHAKTLIQPIHLHFISNSKQQIQEHRNKVMERKNSVQNVSIGDKPAYKVVLIPANCSSSKLMQHLSENSPDTPSVMIESEIDTMAMTQSSDFGNYSDILRKIFHNEPISLSRKTDNEFYDVPNPKMSLVLTGTPGQLLNLIKNNEDGLFSRFLVMSFNTNQGWKKMGPCPNCINLSNYFKHQGNEYFKLWEFISKSALEILLSRGQWDVLESYCDEKFTEIVLSHGPNATSIIKRHGLMAFKICMVLTAMRKYEEQNNLAEMTCRNEDFETALFLIDQSLYCSLDTYDFLPGAKLTGKNKRRDNFYNVLPKEFTRSFAVLKAKESNIGIRSADRYLTDWVQDKLLTQPTKGKYLKVI